MLSDLITSDDGVQRVLVAPLNWGLGHATRMIPLIDHCLSLGKEVAIASDGIALQLLEREYPQLKSYSLPGYNIRYSKQATGTYIMLQSPKIALAARAEYLVTAKIVADFKPDLIVSDNRLGVRHPVTKSVIVTHQVAVITPTRLLTPIARSINRFMLNHFDSVWIMDHPDRRLTGQLSNPEGLKSVESLGVLTRLTRPAAPSDTVRQILVILSGPEPQRTLLEEILLDVLPPLGYTFTLVRGTDTPLSPRSSQMSNLDLRDLVGTQTLNTLINTSDLVITRTGYTSVMDLDSLDKQAILIPTPGQPEQEYLGKHLSDHPRFTMIDQSAVRKDLALRLEKLVRSRIND